MSLPTQSVQGDSGEQPVAIVFFDGVCSLCNHFVDFLVQRDLDHQLRYAPLQGTAAATRLAAAERDLSTVVFWLRGRTYTRSRAAIEIIGQLGGIYRVVVLLRLVPRVLRDWAYDGVAARRYRWFGKREACRLPTAEERALFLD